MKIVDAKNRRKVIIISLGAVMFIYLCRLFYMQVIDDSYDIYAKQNALRILTEYPARGLIYDRNDSLLVYNEATYDLMCIFGQIKTFDTLELCNLLDLTYEDILVRLKKAKKQAYLPFIFEKQISKEDYGVLQEKLYKYAGFYVQSRTLRKYPNNTAAHTLGYIGEVSPERIEADNYYKMGDYIGISGLERYYEKTLRGTKGQRLVLVDVYNREHGSFKNGEMDVIPIPGQNMWISIDMTLQMYGEKLMQNKKGSIVAIEPSTGEILCLVTSPSYNPNLLVGRSRSSNYCNLLKDSINVPLFNRAIMAMYPPGSTFKLVNALIAEQEGFANPNTRFSCEHGYHYSGRVLGCHNHPSPLNLSGAVQHSCNAYFCKLFASMIDNRKKYHSTQEAYNTWQNYILKLGFGQKFGSDIPSELKGFIPTSEYFDKIYGKQGWRAQTIISMAIGQGEVSTTPLQMANLTAIIANKGFYYTPHFLKAINRKDSLSKEYSQPHDSGIDACYFDPVIKGMEDVVLAGTGRRATVPGIRVAGKTGTAENPHGANHSVFVSFAPVNSPKIALAVIVENSGAGGVWAASIAGLMIEYYLTRKITRPDVEEMILDANFIK